MHMRKQMAVIAGGHEKLCFYHGYQVALVYHEAAFNTAEGKASQKQCEIAPP